MTYLRTVHFLLWFVISNLSAGITYPGMNEWYHPNRMMLAGAGGTVPHISTDVLNPAALWTLQREFDISIIRYPADITAQSLHLAIPAKRAITVYGLRHMNYGLFEGRDENNNLTDTYSASNTWLTWAAAGTLDNRPIRWGTSAGLYYSKLQDYQSAVLTISGGIIILSKKMGARLGISLSNGGMVLNTYAGKSEELPTALIVSFSKEMAYLPLELSVDAEKKFNHEKINVSLGGVFNLRKNIHLKLGTSINRLDQASGNSLTRDYFADTGIGLSWEINDFRFDGGIYTFGPGGWSSGLSMGVKF